jgi:hypothetical protein
MTLIEETAMAIESEMTVDGGISYLNAAQAALEVVDSRLLSDNVMFSADDKLIETIKTEFFDTKSENISYGTYGVVELIVRAAIQAAKEGK